MKILLIGECYSDNLGDPLLCQTVASILKENFEGCDVDYLDISGRTSTNVYVNKKKFKQRTKCLYKIASSLFPFVQTYPQYLLYKSKKDTCLRVWNLTDNLLDNNQYDAAVFAGGSLFMDFFAPMIHIVVTLLSKHKVNIIFHACGMSGLSGNSVSVLQKDLRKKVVKLISLRDSFVYFNDVFNIGNKVSETFDTALLSHRYFEASKTKTADFGIGIIEKEEYFSFQKKMIEFFMNSNFSWKIFVNGSALDFDFACRLLNEIGISDDEKNKYICPCPITTGDLVKTVTSFKKIISFRMHSQIIATSFGIPNFGFIWDSKISDFYCKIDMPDNCCKPNENINFDLLIKKLNDNEIDLMNCAEIFGKESEKSLVCAISDVVKSSKRK